MPPPAEPSGRTGPNLALDLVRGAAAVLVVLGHARVFLSRGLDVDAGALPPLQRLLLLPTSFAQESVAIFFVLSGFLVGGQVLRDVGAGRFTWRAYLAKRLSRLWTVLLPGLALTLALDSVSARSPLFPLLGTLPLDARAFVCNLAFLQQSRCGWYGSNESLWSLAYEFWFYVLFAGATVVAFATTSRAWSRAAVGLGVLALALLAFGPDLLRLLPSWLLGVIVAVVVRRRSVSSPPSGAGSVRRLLLTVALLLTGMIAVDLVLAEETPITQVVRFALVGAAAAPLITVLALRPPAAPSRAVRALAATGGWSFSTYVFHAPIIKLLVVTLLTSGVALDGPRLVGAVYVIAAVGYLLTVPLWALTERHTARVRGLLLGLLRVRGPDPGGATSPGSGRQPHRGPASPRPPH